MACNTNSESSNKEIIAHRRERVAHWRLRGLTQREIAAALAEELPSLVNPDTGKPYSLGTINADLKALDAQWKREAKASTDLHRAQMLAELRAVRRAAWEGAATPRAQAALIGALEGDEDGEVRHAAAKALGQVGVSDLRAVLLALKQEAELLGLDAPTKIAPTTPDGKEPQQHGLTLVLTDADRAARAIELLDAAGARRVGSAAGECPAPV